MSRATGTFEVKMAPLEHSAGDPGLGRMSLDKQYHGELIATAKGEMLTAMTAVNGSAVYVAIERVTGTLGGRSGSFALHHTGIMTRGTPSLSVRIVPDSGTGGLEGLTGTMDILIEGRQHSYVLEYEL
jgi:Protein of unknown function (DUF3224)